MCIYVYICVYICVCVFMCICIYIYTHTHTVLPCYSAIVGVHKMIGESGVALNQGSVDYITFELKNSRFNTSSRYV